MSDVKRAVVRPSSRTGRYDRTSTGAGTRQPFKRRISRTASFVRLLRGMHVGRLPTASQIRQKGFYSIALLIVPVSSYITS